MKFSGFIKQFLKSFFLLLGITVLLIGVSAVITRSVGYFRRNKTDFYTGIMEKKSAGSGFQDIVREGVTRPSLDYRNIKGIGVLAYISRQARFDRILAESESLGLNTIVFFFKDEDPRGDVYRSIPVTNRIKKTDGSYRIDIVHKKKLIPRRLGNVFFNTTNHLAERIGAKRNFVTNIGALQRRVWSHGLELGARVCLFADFKIAEYLRSKNSAPINTVLITNSAQSRWFSNETKFPVTVTKKGKPRRDEIYADPLNPEVLEYNISLVKELYNEGIRIFIFDYVRKEDPLDEKNYHPDIYLFNHVAIEQAMKTIWNALTLHRRENPWGPEPLYSISVFGRVLYRTYNGTMDPVGQNIKTFFEIGYRISSMDYTHLLLREWRQKPYEGRRRYLSDGMEKIPREAFIPWIDSVQLSAGKDARADFVYEELRAVIDSGISSFIFWTPSGNEREYERIFAALRRNTQSGSKKENEKE